MKKLLALGLLCASALPIQAQTAQRLWPANAPGALGQTDADIPTLTPFLAPNPTGAAMVICPGGGYSGLSMDHEGTNYARWLNQIGVSAFVLKYRLGSRGYRHPVMLRDAARALRTTRFRAKEWKIDPNRIGIMGSSAGGHLAATLLTHFDAGKAGDADPIERESSRPNLGVLCYPVITMGPDTHGGSRFNLLGPNPSPELVENLSNELQVTPQTPPTFLWHTVADELVKVENSMLFASALRKSGVPFDLHIYQNGGHGLGLGDETPPFVNALPWTHDLKFWLGEQGFLTRVLVATSEKSPQNWRFTLENPPADWMKTGFNDANWKSDISFGKTWEDEKNEITRVESLYAH